MNVLVRGGNETFEQRMRLVRLAHEFRMELARDIKRMMGEFDDFHQLAVGRRAAENKASFLKFFAIRVIEFVAVAMTFLDDKGTVKGCRLRAERELARHRAEAHGAALFRNLALRVEEGDDGMRRVRIKFRGMRLVEFEDIAGVFNGGNLHAEAQAKIGNFIFAGP